MHGQPERNHVGDTCRTDRNQVSNALQLQWALPAAGSLCHAVVAEPSSASAATAERFAKKRRPIVRRLGSESDGSVIITQPRIGDTVQHISDKTADYNEKAPDDDCRHEQRIVTRVDGVDDHQSHPRPRKNFLDEYSPG